MINNLTFIFDSYEAFEKKIPTIKIFLEECKTEKKTLIFYSFLEAVNNVFEHTLWGNEPLRIELTFQKIERTLLINLLHNGSSFDFEEVLERIGDPEHYLERHRMEGRGRGIPIMLQCSDDVSFELEGRLVRMTFQLEEED